jgi:hypothetical protein
MAGLHPGDGGACTAYRNQFHGHQREPGSFLYSTSYGSYSSPGSGSHWKLSDRFRGSRQGSKSVHSSVSRSDAM